MQRAKSKFRERDREDHSRQMLEILNQINARSEYMDRFVIKNNGRVIFLSADEVDWIEISGNSFFLHAGQSSHLIRETLNNLERQLDPRKFLRIHRSSMVNINSVKEMHVAFNDEQVVLLKDGSQLTLSRRYREKVSQALGTTI